MIPVHCDSKGEENQAFPDSSSTVFSISLNDPAPVLMRVWQPSFGKLLWLALAILTLAKEKT